MTWNGGLESQALAFHRQMPDRIKAYLAGRGISEDVVHHHLLGWHGSRITIPIRDAAGEIAFFKLARDPEAPEAEPKMLATPGSSAALYGVESLSSSLSRIVICEGEFDRLVLESRGIPAVTSTAGALAFRHEWVPFFEGIPEVYVCFDRDEVGRRGAERVGALLPKARLVELPEEVGDGGDVTDFFVRLGRSTEDFFRLLAEAKPLPLSPIPVGIATVSSWSPDPRALRLKREVRLKDVVAPYVALRARARTLVGSCPFHAEKTPSFVVFRETETFHCFGCGAHGDAITFLRRVRRLSFSEALDALETMLSSDAA